MSHQVISTILRHDTKQTSYKIALLRALNDVVLAFPDLRNSGRDVAVPLSLLAEHWIAYYWPFADPRGQILQGVPTSRAGMVRQDVSFRRELTELRRLWEQETRLDADPADGFLLMNEMRVPRKRKTYSKAFVRAFRNTRRKITTALRQPIRYAGPGQHEIFPAPARLRELPDVAAVPGTDPNDACLRIPADLWRSFRDVSLWVEALCVHEWSLLTERLDGGVDRGDAYKLLTAHPQTRLSLTWERNHIDVLFEEGHVFTCPWTERQLTRAKYQIDHVIPVSVYPLHELWNLVPSDERFNMHVKRHRLPGRQAMQEGLRHIAATFSTYGSQADLSRAFAEDVAVRFSIPSDPWPVAHALDQLVEGMADARNLERF